MACFRQCVNARLLILLVLGLCTLCCADESGDNVEVGRKINDDDLQSMSSAQLLKLESDTMQKVNETQLQLAQLRTQTTILKQEQDTINEAANKMQGARDWEAKEKQIRDEELARVKKEVEQKQLNIKDMKRSVTELKTRIDELKLHLDNLTAQRDNVVHRNEAPTLSDVLDARAESWSPMTRNVYRKTRDTVLPALTGVTGDYRRRVASSPFLEWFATFLLMSFVFGSAFVGRRVYLRVRGHFTIQRLLFLGDSLCFAFWALMLLCYCFLWTDPLVVVQTRTPIFFFVFQLSALIFYVNFVLLRVLLLATKLSLSALGETLAVVVVGHHYYVRVWQPAMMDSQIHGTFFYYFCYAWLFLAFAYNRVSEFAPLKQLRGPKLPPLVALRVLITRFFSNEVPEGDLESRPFVEDDDDDGHEN